MSLRPLAPQASASANSATSALVVRTLFYFFGTAGCGWAGSGTVVDGWPCGVTVTLGVPGFAGFGAGLAGCEVFVGPRSVTLDAPPPAREDMIASVSDVTMNNPAATAVAFDKTVADPRGPNAVCEPMPPNAPARSAALPLCSNTTITRNTQIRIWRIVTNIIMSFGSRRDSGVTGELHRHYSRCRTLFSGMRPRLSHALQ